MTVLITVENNPKNDNFLKLEDDQFIELWAFLHLPATSRGSMYGIKMYNILQEAIKREGSVYSVGINNLITSMDIIRQLGIIINVAMTQEEKLIWTYV